MDTIKVDTIDEIKSQLIIEDDVEQRRAASHLTEVKPESKRSTQSTEKIFLVDQEDLPKSQYKLLKQYKNYCATPDGKVYKIKPGIEIKPDENMLIDISKDDLLECRYYYDKIINAILIYFSLIGENSKKKYTKRQASRKINFV